MFLTRLFFVRGLALVALAASAASLAEQTFGDGTFCSFESGCESVTSSEYGRVAGVPLPTFGLIGYAAILALTLISVAKAIRLARGLAILGAAAGAAFVAIQVAVLGQVCQLCLVADVAAIMMGGLAVRPFEAPPPTSAVRAVWSVLGVVSILVPLSLAYTDIRPDPPAWVMAEWTPDAITVVEVTDFECDHCRRADEYIRDVLKSRPEVKLVRIPIEMPKHANSRAAAIAFRAAKAQGRGPEMAEALFASKALAAPDCRALAVKLGLKMDDYDRVVVDPDTDRDVDVASHAARQAGPGVPLIWIHSHMIYGSPTIDNFDKPLARARPHRVK